MSPATTTPPMGLPRGWRVTPYLNPTAYVRPHEIRAPWALGEGAKTVSELMEEPGFRDKYFELNRGNPHLATAWLRKIDRPNTKLVGDLSPLSFALALQTLHYTEHVPSRGLPLPQKHRLTIDFLHEALPAYLEYLGVRNVCPPRIRTLRVSSKTYAEYLDAPDSKAIAGGTVLGSSRTVVYTIKNQSYLFDVLPHEYFHSIAPYFWLVTRYGAQGDFLLSKIRAGAFLFFRSRNYINYSAFNCLEEGLTELLARSFLFWCLRNCKAELKRLFGLPLEMHFEHYNWHVAALLFLSGSLAQKKKRGKREVLRRLLKSHLEGDAFLYTGLLSLLGESGFRKLSRVTGSNASMKALIESLPLFKSLREALHADGGWGSHLSKSVLPALENL